MRRLNQWMPQGRATATHKPANSGFRDSAVPMIAHPTPCAQASGKMMAPSSGIRLSSQLWNPRGPAPRSQVARATSPSRMSVPNRLIGTKPA